MTTATLDLLACGGDWREGIACERLFCCWAAVPGWKRSWAAHVLLVAMECLQFPLKPSMLGRLAGRLWAGLGLARRRVAIGRQAASSRKEVVIHAPRLRGQSRPARRSRAAG